MFLRQCMLTTCCGHKSCLDPKEPVAAQLMLIHPKMFTDSGSVQECILPCRVGCIKFLMLYIEFSLVTILRISVSPTTQFQMLTLGFEVRSSRRYIRHQLVILCIICILFPYNGYKKRYFDQPGNDVYAPTHTFQRKNFLSFASSNSPRILRGRQAQDAPEAAFCRFFAVI